MTQWQIDENQSKSSVLIPELWPRISPPISPSLPHSRPSDAWIAPKLRPKWGIVAIPPKLKAISPNPADQTPQNPVCYTLPMPIAIKVHRNYLLLVWLCWENLTAFEGQGSH
ncbi:MAG: hypothetical protein H7Y37_02050, partial [Anaerolineae bacterium]|nr:hypothetical protein [Gloeobacterales cyanobacterium ES-bin-313]